MLTTSEFEPKRSSNSIPLLLLFVAMLGISAVGGAGFVYLHQELAVSKAVANEALTKADVLMNDLKTEREQNGELKGRVDSLAIETATLREKNSELEKKLAAKPANTRNSDPNAPHITINGTDILPGVQTHTFTLGPDGDFLGGGIRLNLTAPILPPAETPPAPSAPKGKGGKEEAF